MKTEIQVGDYAKPRLIVTSFDDEGQKVDVKILPLSSKVAKALKDSGVVVEG